MYNHLCELYLDEVDEFQLLEGLYGSTLLSKIQSRPEIQSGQPGRGTSHWECVPKSKTHIHSYLVGRTKDPIWNNWQIVWSLGQGHGDRSETSWGVSSSPPRSIPGHRNPITKPLETVILLLLPTPLKLIGTVGENQKTNKTPPPTIIHRDIFNITRYFSVTPNSFFV